MDGSDPPNLLRAANVREATRTARIRIHIKLASGLAAIGIHAFLGLAPSSKAYAHAIAHRA